MKIRSSLAFFLIFLGSNLVLSQEPQVISESRAAIMQAADPHAYMVDKAKRRTVQEIELYPYESLTGDFFILPGSDIEEKPITAYVVLSPERAEDFWPQAVWLSCLDTLAAIPRQQSTLFVLIPPKADNSCIIDEISRFDSLQAIILLENSKIEPKVQLEFGSKTGQSPRSIVAKIYSAFKTEGLYWSESPAASFFLRYGYLSESGLLSGFHERSLPALSLRINLNESAKPGMEQMLLAALSKFETGHDKPEDSEYNYLTISIRMCQGTISEKFLIVMLLACFSMILVFWHASKKTGIEKKANIAILLNGIALLLIFFAITFIFINVSSRTAFGGITGNNPAVGFAVSAFVFSLLILAVFSICFSLLTYAKSSLELGYMVFLLLLFDAGIFTILYLPLSPYFCLCALLFWISRHKLWLSTLCCLLLASPVVSVAFFNIGTSTQSPLPVPVTTMILQGTMSTLILYPLFLWISVIINQWFSSVAKKRLVIGAGISLAVILGFIIFMASGYLL